jgi:hypothetical protein
LWKKRKTSGFAKVRDSRLTLVRVSLPSRPATESVMVIVPPTLTVVYSFRAPRGC